MTAHALFRGLRCAEVLHAPDCGVTGAGAAHAERSEGPAPQGAQLEAFLTKPCNHMARLAGTCACQAPSGRTSRMC